MNKIIAVAGDVCIDWLSIPIEPTGPQDVGGDTRPNWQLRGGEHMFAVRGGAWLTADLTTVASGASADVRKPKPLDSLENISPDKIIHSLLRVCDFPPVEKDVHSRWRVKSFDGFSGPLPSDTSKPDIIPTECEEAPGILLLDDAGNGFRERRAAWPVVLNANNAGPVVIYKCRRPLLRGPLWEQVRAHHAAKTVVVLTADDLRSSGATISRGLSWERTAFETWQVLSSLASFDAVRKCAWVVVTYGLEGALIVRTESDCLDTALLWFSPLLCEGDLVRCSNGDMTGFGSAFSAALAASLDPGKLDADSLASAVKRGMLAARRILAAGFGPTKDASGKFLPPCYPVGPEIFSEMEIADFPLVNVRLPALKAGISRLHVEKQRHWRIIDQAREEPMIFLARKTLTHGAKKTFEKIPTGVFGDLITVERFEIESYRSVLNLMLEYVRIPTPERPLCLAVFGQPGTGKSFGVTQVAKCVAAEARNVSIEKIEFNVSQWDSPAQLVQALHRVRDFAIRGQVPLVFFDEFDSSIGETKLAWLKSFLAPMQDGVFSDGNFNYPIGRAIFVFAGGTAHTFADFVRMQVAKAKAEAKAPDFLSRLRGHVDVFGFSSPIDTNLIRRALVLRVALWRKFRALFDPSEILRIEHAVMTAFLNAPNFRHSSRSIEAIVDMSRLVGFKQFESSSLPPELQLEEHVDAANFKRLLTLAELPLETINTIAEKIHARYLDGELKKGKSLGERPALRKWNDLDAVYQNSNREQAAHYAIKVATIGCEIVPANASQPPFEFTLDEIELLAEQEHERWCEERRIIQPDHQSLKSWAMLKKDEENNPGKQKETDKDREAIGTIPAILKEAELAIRRIV